jgi:hypothetical protein
MASMPDAHLCEYKHDLKGYYRQGDSVRPAMVEIRKVAASETISKIGADIEGEKEYLFLLLLLPGVCSMDCHVRGGG